MGAIRPLYQLLQFKKRYGDTRFRQLSQAMADMRRDRLNQDFAWPDWNYALSNAAMIMEGRSLQSLRTQGIPDHTKTAWQRVMTFVTWQMTQGVYVFDRDAFDALWATEPAREIQAATLERLPEWCPYIEVPEGSEGWTEDFRGFFAWLDIAYLRAGEKVHNTCYPALVIMVDRADDHPFLLSIDLVHPTLDECLGRTYGFTGAAMDEACRRVWPMLSVLLYLCSVNAEIVSAQGQPRPAAPARPARPALEPKRWQVGWRVGAARRQAKAIQGQAGAEETARGHASPRPHVRRAHFHGFWNGPRNQPDSRQLEVKWLPPTFVNVDADHPVISTERSVMSREQR